MVLLLDCCSLVADVSVLANCPYLTWLDLSECRSLTDIVPLYMCTSLEILDVRKCTGEVTAQMQQLKVMLLGASWHAYHDSQLWLDDFGPAAMPLYVVRCLTGCQVW